ncbi:hypothetical protein PNEG_02673 [Pneumocystis murina B123]|uniref:Adenylyl cyclase-associated protein n=1 Tax=Pneumocystis murina (strain B123) TaxID=1069680 RepID=M7P4X3_PNEMU|nr:hypothetical protein PNEG_02673 [Pneumocystis murina B123]EMR08890.1 hypothetical protein PNEG_02673 [Pneumocystis murina B123]
MISNIYATREKNIEANLHFLVKRFESVAERLEKLSGLSVESLEVSKDEEKKPETVFKSFFFSIMKEYQCFSEKLDKEVMEQAQYVLEAFEMLGEFIEKGSCMEKPDFSSSEFQTLIQPLQDKIDKVINIRNKNRGSEMFNHLSMVSEGIVALGWITVEPTPVLYIGDMKDSAQFYANRILKEKGSLDTKWVYSFINLLTELQSYVKLYYNAGFLWNSNKTNLENDKKIHNSTDIEDKTEADAVLQPRISESRTKRSNNIESVFSELNMGESITEKLRKVNKNQTTHKSPSHSAQSSAPSDYRLSQVSTTEEKKTKLPCKKELAGSRWNIENFEDNHNIVINQLETNQTIYIFNCKRCTISLKGKANTVYIDQSFNCGLIIDTLISGIESTRSASLEIQISGYTPTITLDQCDNSQIYLSPKCLSTEIITSKFSSINVHVLEEKNGDYIEHHIPEMLKSTIINGKLVTNFVEHLS